MGITHHTLHLQCRHKSTVHISPHNTSSSPHSSPPVSPGTSSPSVSRVGGHGFIWPQEYQSSSSNSNSQQHHHQHHSSRGASAGASHNSSRPADSPPITPTFEHTSGSGSRSSSNTYSKHDSICPRCVHEKRETRISETHIAGIRVVADVEPVDPEEDRDRDQNGNDDRDDEDEINAAAAKGNNGGGIFTFSQSFIAGNWKGIIAGAVLALVLLSILEQVKRMASSSSSPLLPLLWLNVKNLSLWNIYHIMEGKVLDLIFRARSAYLVLDSELDSELELDVGIGMDTPAGMWLHVLWKAAVYAALCAWGLRTFVRLSMKTRRGRNWWVWI